MIRSMMGRWKARETTTIGRYPLAIGLYASLFLAALAFPGALDALGDGMRAMGILPVALLGITSVWRVSRHPRCEPKLRGAWRLLALSVTVAFLGVVLWRVSPQPWQSLGHLGWILSYLGVFVALVRLSRATNDHPAWRMPPFWLDVSIVALGVTIAVWHFLLGPVVYGYGSPGAALGIFYALGDLVLLLAGVAFLLRSPRRLMRRVGGGWS